MKILFYFGHPAQYLFLREAIRNLIRSGEFNVIILIKTKDVLEDIIKADGLEYRNILTKQRGLSKLSVLFSFFKRLLVLLPILIKERPKLLISTDAPTAILGKILRIKRITITEDDYDIIKNLAKLTYPYTSTILCPSVCKVGKYEKKKIGYNGYMKLGYLHPNVFSPNYDIFEKYNIIEKFVLIRLARLTAHHDFGASGMTDSLLSEVMTICENNNYRVLISSEASINEDHKSKLLNIAPSDMHHVLSQASLLISDSQSMSVEAAMLGVPSLRFSSFAGKISVLEELEHKYNLTYGISPSNPQLLLNKTKELLSQNDLKKIFALRKEIMLKDKIDVTAFLTWFLSNYPQSAAMIYADPTIQFRFC